MKRSEIKHLLKEGEMNQSIDVKGWVRTKRGSKNVSFIALNDGSTIQNIQVVVDFQKIDAEVLESVHTGACIAVQGELLASQGSGQSFEINAHNIEVLGTASPDEYPLQPKKHSLEFLREIAHLRFRTNTFSAINRVRHAVIFGIHDYFNARGFYNIHTPIITGSDAEGAGETFKVSSLDFNNVPKTEEGEIDFKQDFFGKETNLT
ncbi:MAG: asparagine--tRNA ligase, partial [Verrucomicrobia bacterium]|nr:asparagine--tRNA ligase [Verrucomicrobiota bacterium]